MFKNFGTAFSIFSDVSLCHSRISATVRLKEFRRQFTITSRNHQRKTSLYNLHIAHKGKMVNFGGFDLPVQYGNQGISQSHIHTRNSCSIFDVSHMLQTEIRGEDRIEFLESLCTTDIQGLPENGSALSLFINDDTGGILDDFIVTKTSEGYLYLVSNASRRDHDSKLLLQAQEASRKNGKDVTIKFLEPETQSLIAVQGPKTAELLDPLTDVDLTKLYFMQSTTGTVCGIKGCRVTRCGYTGEDGVEISVDAARSEQLVENLLKSNPDMIKLAGLGARDTLRLEAGLCLYGNDIDETVTPVQAGLNFTIGKRRREKKDFPGAPIILLEMLSGPYKKRVGLKSLSHGPPARQGAQIFIDNVNVGNITSGCPSPNLGCNIAMGYVKKEYCNPGTYVKVQIRDKFFDMEICKLPFVPTKYYIKQKVKK